MPLDKCPHCGAVVDPDEVFCAGCGKGSTADERLTEAEKRALEPPPAPLSKRPALYLILGAVIFASRAVYFGADFAPKVKKADRMMKAADKEDDRRYLELIKGLSKYQDAIDIANGKEPSPPATFDKAWEKKTLAQRNAFKLPNFQGEMARDRLKGMRRAPGVMYTTTLVLVFILIVAATFSGRWRLASGIVGISAGLLLWVVQTVMNEYAGFYQMWLVYLGFGALFTGAGISAISPTRPDWMMRGR